MAEVFEAELTGELGFVRKVAIKRLLESAALDRELAQRFLDEARIASRLHHANLVSVVDLGLLDGLPFQVLELVEGLDAYQLMQRAGGTLPVEIALAIAAAVAHALDHAHTAVDEHGAPLGIVHRDVKPSNVLVAWSGDVKLGDFGIAVAHARESRTEAGIAVGTQGFIAPEQRARAQLDGRTDVFALGLTLHALVAGYTPLRDVAVEVGVLAGERVPLAPTLPEDVRALIARAVEPAREARPTAGELADALGGALAMRISRDARACLRDFLATLQPRTPRAGALDALFGVEVVLASDDGIARYETRVPPASEAPTAAAPEVSVSGVPTAPVLAAPAEAARPPTAATAASPSRAPEAPSAPGPAPRRRLAPLAGGLGVLGAGGVLAWRLVGSSAPEAAPPDAPLVARAPDVAVDAGAPPPDEPAPDAAVAAPADAALEPPRDAGVIAARRRPVDAGASPPPERAAPPAGTGYVQVVGEDLIGARVLVDGRVVGSVPNKIAVPVGAHRVEVERRDGTRLPALAVEVTVVHTLADPLRPRW